MSKQLPPMTAPAAQIERTRPLRAKGGAHTDAGPGEWGMKDRERMNVRRRPRELSFDSPGDPDIKSLLDAADREIGRATTSAAAERRRAFSGGPSAAPASEKRGASSSSPEDDRAGIQPRTSGVPARISPARPVGGSLTLNSLLDGGSARADSSVPVDMSLPYADVSRLRDLLRAANKRVAELEGEIADLKAKTRLTGGTNVDTLLWHTQGANGMTSQDILRPMPADEPPTWQRDKEKLTTKIRDLVLAMHKERTSRESVEHAQKIEIMGLTRRLKYALMQIQGLHKKEEEQARYISDCEAAILKQQDKIRALEARLRTGKSQLRSGGPGKDAMSSTTAQEQPQPQGLPARPDARSSQRVDAPQADARQARLLEDAGDSESYSYYSSEEDPSNFAQSAQSAQLGPRGDPDTAHASKKRIPQRRASPDDSSGYSYSSSTKPSLRDAQLVGREDLVVEDLDRAGIQQAAGALAAEVEGSLDPLTVPQGDMTVAGL